MVEKTTHLRKSIRIDLIEEHIVCVFFDDVFLEMGVVAGQIFILECSNKWRRDRSVADALPRRFSDPLFFIPAIYANFVGLEFLETSAKSPLRVRIEQRIYE